jgi:hypothetical protein
MVILPNFIFQWNINLLTHLLCVTHSVFKMLSLLTFLVTFDYFPYLKFLKVIIDFFMIYFITKF